MPETARALLLASFCACLGALAACGGGSSSSGTTGGGSSTGGGGTTGGGCAQALCNGVCCTTGDECIGNACCAQAQACGAACCASGDECIANTCCAQAQSCGTTCCASGAVCVADQAGNHSCATSCTDSSQCPTDSPCCAPLTNGGSACLANGVVQGQECRCTTGSECSSGCCAPAVDSSGNPIGPYICKANDGAPYDCCEGSTSCTGGTNNCCAIDSSGNYVCSAPCTNASNCGAAKCDTLTLAAFSSCSGTTFCGP
jgi:hypothetical protein